MKMWEREREIEEAVAFKRKEDIPSGPEAVLGGRLEMRERIISSVQRSDSGQGEMRREEKDQEVEHLS